MAEDRTLTQRSHKVMYCEVPDENGGTAVIHRMKGFTSLSTAKNPKEYNRQYVDEVFEQTDVVGISSSMDFGFDQYKGDPVHDYLVDLIDNEAIGTDAVVTLYLVDFTRPGKTDGAYVCTRKQWSLIPSGEGDSTDAYTYSGTFRTKSSRTMGEAKVSNDPEQLTMTFIEDSGVTPPTPDTPDVGA